MSIASPAGSKKRDRQRQSYHNNQQSQIRQPGRPLDSLGELTFSPLFNFVEELLRVAPDLHGRLGPDVVFDSLPRPAIFSNRFNKQSVLLFSPALSLFRQRVSLSCRL